MGGERQQRAWCVRRDVLRENVVGILVYCYRLAWRDVHLGCPRLPHRATTTTIFIFSTDILNLRSCGMRMCLGRAGSRGGQTCWRARTKQPR